jgi:3-oxoacyl-[acyl-carrier protein] reductase
MAEAATKRRVLVTGGGRGLGAAIVRTLAAAGHDVTFTYRSASAEADALVKELGAAYPQAAFAAHQSDLADKAAVEQLVAVIEKEGPYSAFVHNAGQSYDTLAVMLDQVKGSYAP